MHRSARRAIAVGTLVVVAGLGLVSQTGGYLLGFDGSASATAAQDVEHPGLEYAIPGPHAVGVRRIRTDTAPLDMTVWYPAVSAADAEPGMRSAFGLRVMSDRTVTALATHAGTAQPGAVADTVAAPYPLVVLSPGFAITPGSYAWLAEHLASHGMVVVAPHHAETLDPARLWRAAIDRPRVIAETREFLEIESSTAEALTGLADADTVAVLGHSLGGYAALAAGGARLDADAFAGGCATAREDKDPIVFLCDALEPRLDTMVAAATVAPAPVDAVVSMAGDAAMFGTDGLTSLTAPLLVIGGTADRDSPFAWSSALAFEGAASERKMEVALDGAGHFVFTNECDRARRIVSLVPLGFCEDPTWDRAHAHAVVRHYVTAFLLAALADDGKAATILDQAGPPPGVGLRGTP